MPQRDAGPHLMFPDGRNDVLPFGDQVDDAVVNFVKPLAKTGQFVGSQCVF
jgi:hypothetical protein